MSDGTTGPGNGISGGYQGDDPIILRAMIACTAIAWYNCAELIILVFVVFKRYSGLYFWSLLVASVAIIPYSVGAWAKQVGISGSSLAMVALSTIAWFIMVPGQSLVLWSRLHFITQDQRLIKGILIMIIVDAIILCIPTAVLTLGSNSDKPYLFVKGYAVMEKIQMTWFTVQELIISFVYLVEVRRVLTVVYDGRFRKLMFELVAINIAIICMDMALLGVEYASLYQIEVTLKGMVYSIKLKLEFGVLSKLVKIATKRQGVYDLDVRASGDDGKEASTIGMSTIATLPSTSTYGTSPIPRTTFGPNGKLNSGPNPDTEEYNDFERSVSFSQADPIPKPLQQVTSYQPMISGSRRSSTQDLYPGRLGQG